MKQLLGWMGYLALFTVVAVSIFALGNVVVKYVAGMLD